MLGTMLVCYNLVSRCLESHVTLVQREAVSAGHRRSCSHWRQSYPIRQNSWALSSFLKLLSFAQQERAKIYCHLTL